MALQKVFLKEGFEPTKRLCRVDFTFLRVITFAKMSLG